MYNKLHSIEKIKSYKSFKSYEWSSFFKPGNNFHEQLNIVYGENGAGKSSICNILKSVCDKKAFVNSQIPDEICLKFNDGDYEFPNGTSIWNKNKGVDDFLFFDREFVHENIHLGNERKTDATGQEQKSGKMIIEFDSEAIRLSQLRKSLKKEISKSGEEEPETIYDTLKNYQEDHKDTLAFSLGDEEKPLFDTYKDKTKEEIAELKNELTEEKKEVEKKLETDTVTQKQVNDIQKSIFEIKNEKIELSLSEQSIYQAIFNFDLKEQVQIEAEQDLITKIRKHKDFFQTGIEIREEHKTKCPFCQSENEEENIGKIIKAYNDIFDDTYKKQLQDFEDNKKTLIVELENIINSVEKWDLNSLFVYLSELNQTYKIKEIYSVEEQKKYRKPTTNQIADLKEKIENLKKPSNEDIAEIYNKVKATFNSLETFFNDIYTFVKEKNQLIRKFKAHNTDEKIQQRIKTNDQKVREINLKLDFFNEKKIEKQKQKEDKEKELANIQEEFNHLKSKYDEVKKEYETYCSNEVFEKILKKIEEYFDNFKFSFKLRLKTEKTGNKTEFPFAFNVLDNEGNERDFKEGLSEGELQVLSLCFFFAFLDIQTNPQDKILVFDDPITSLDNNNLKHLVNLLAEEYLNFSQTFVFTHHRTFWKFLRSKFDLLKGEKKAKEYYIYRNDSDLGGSFICLHKYSDIEEKLRTWKSTQLKRSKEGIFSEEVFIIEFGQYLRYGIESYIKNDLLHINKPNLGNVIDLMIHNQENNKILTVDEMKELKEIYSFCNWTTSHVDQGDDHSLKQLEDRIQSFMQIRNK